VFPLRFETTGAIADAIASRNAMALDADYYSSYRDRISSVTTLDVLRCAQQYLQPERLHVIAVGDAPAIRRSMDGLKLGPMSERQAIEPLDT
jgi:zinc protease